MPDAGVSRKRQMRCPGDSRAVLCPSTTGPLPDHRRPGSQSGALDCSSRGWIFAPRSHAHASERSDTVIVVPRCWRLAFGADRSLQALRTARGIRFSPRIDAWRSADLCRAEPTFLACKTRVSAILPRVERDAAHLESVAVVVECSPLSARLPARRNADAASIRGPATP